MTLNFYHAANNPTGLTGTVGGAVSTDVISGYLGELFAHVAAPPTGTNTGVVQHRKVYIQNNYGTTSLGTKVWIDGLEHSGQIHIAPESGANQSITHPTGTPENVTGWVDPVNYLSGMDFGDITSGAASGIWIRQTLSGIQVEDPYATFTLHAGGLVAE